MSAPDAPPLEPGWYVAVKVAPPRRVVVVECAARRRAIRCDVDGKNVRATDPRFAPQGWYGPFLSREAAVRALVAWMQFALVERGVLPGRVVRSGRGGPRRRSPAPPRAMPAWFVELERGESDASARRRPPAGPPFGSAPARRP